MSNVHPVATPEQIAYLKKLCLQAGKTDLQASALVGKTDFDALTKIEASKVIGLIKQSLGVNKESPTKFPTPLTLRRIIEAGEEIPAEFDEHARWVIEHARLAVDLKHLAGQRLRSGGVNRGGDIRMSDLLKYFKTWDELAKAFDVTVPTAKAWGDMLPSSRAYEAEVKTGGFVTAPLRAP